jgi:hypothetical protein
MLSTSEFESESSVKAEDDNAGVEEGSSGFNAGAAGWLESNTFESEGWMEESQSRLVLGVEVSSRAGLG